MCSRHDHAQLTQDEGTRSPCSKGPRRGLLTPKVDVVQDKAHGNEVMGA